VPGDEPARKRAATRLPKRLARELSTSHGEAVSASKPGEPGTTQAFVHVDEASARASDAIGARAFSSGNNVYFGRNQYDPGSPSGRNLLAHELAHVVANGGTGRGPSPLTTARVTPPSSAAEHRAEAASRGQLSISPGSAVDPSYTSSELLRSPLPIDSTIEIHHNVLLGQSEFTLQAGEGVVVELSPDWTPEDEPEEREHELPAPARTPESPPGLTKEVRVTLDRKGFLFDSRQGTCTAFIGRWNHVVLKAQESGTFRFVLDVDDHNPNFYVDGPIHIRKADPTELAEACTPPAEEELSGSEVLHYILDVAGLVPALGIVPDAINAGFYLIEGDWTSAGISAAAMIPIFGEGATLVKLGDRALVRVSKAAAKRVERRSAAQALKETRQALKVLRTPPALRHGLNRLGQAADTQLTAIARDVRITQAGVSREAFESINVATARVRVGDRIEYLSAGNSPGKMMHSEDWILTQVDGLKKRMPQETVVIEQLYSERIPCGECLEKLTRYTNAELFYTVSEYGKRATDLMRAYGL
jgi:Xanthomonas XOO_2897-like deaminase/Domain of unknown function (DUF4157)